MAGLLKVGIKTYGCTLNQADGEIIKSLVLDGANSVSDDIMHSDIAIVNTCTVKKNTERKILQKLADLEKQNKKVIVTGCMAGANRDLIERFAPSASIVTTGNIPSMLDAIGSTLANSRVVLDGPKRRDRIDFLSHDNGIIAKVPVSDGCLSSCSFCETKFARGPLHSFKEEAIIKAIERSAEAGAKEIQLTSQDMGAYGKDKRTNLTELLEKISKLEGDFRVRVGMLNPQHLDGQLDGIISALNSKKFYKFIHLPVEAGSDHVLGSMRRQYTIDEFKANVERLRRGIKGVGIETDIIVGFPSESEEDFGESMELVRQIKFEVTNISRFGARPHASASKMKQLSTSVINERSNRLSRVVRAVQRKINESYISTRVDTLFTEVSKGSINGRAISYRQVVVKESEGHAKIGEKKQVMINNVSANALYGSIAR